MNEPTRYPVERAVQKIVRAYGLCPVTPLTIQIDGGEIELSLPTDKGICWITVRRYNLPDQPVTIGRYGVPADLTRLVEEPPDFHPRFQRVIPTGLPDQIFADRLRTFLKDYSRKDPNVSEADDFEQLCLVVGTGAASTEENGLLPPDAFDVTGRAACGNHAIVGQPGGRTYRIGCTDFGSGGWVH